MSLRDDLIRVLARDPRYSIHAYVFVYEALTHTEELRNRERQRRRKRRRSTTSPPGPESTVDSASHSRAPQPARNPASRHVTGVELCHGARELALKQYGMLAKAVLNSWGLFSTADIGSIVYNLIEAKQLVQNDNDRRADFDDVYEFEDAFQSPNCMTWKFDLVE